MTSSEDQKLDCNQVYNRWLAEVRLDRINRYTRANRKEHLAKLIASLQEYGIDQIEAQMLKRKVVEALVTEEGRKNKGKHKDWVKNTEEDFDDLIQVAYIPVLQRTITPLKSAEHNNDPRIVTWCKTKYGEHVHEDILTAAHQAGHMLWCMCLNETFKRNTGGRL